ncbi:regulator of chromosome condensation 1/beta-lactamase-inhibitor protein II [Pisolithus orientalis]|uniref:regulator of chromosome condensation 1/beta-lactamase-inhibitor protein II n=1 Tax=Pisolithus orientalis TaxID=936130 RepID=UPI0022242B3C|nr:regulator of chromosome condensation 1/beta-lactamase-inhibitor protein II [Pisolithus orientalis]KAI5999375.1 regulator of chromosome condensation 1/beta-lactamase-inhibitor protein II [Pisolithus orientalis]
MPFRLAEIPIEVLLDNFLPLLPVPDLNNLGSTNRFFHNLCNDNTFWKRKIQEDFNFPCNDTARSSGWKFIYRGLRNPRTYVWGESSKGRLGVPKFRKAIIGDAPWPVRLQIGRPGIRIVHLSAAGMSFFAIDSAGDLYAWGTLDGLGFAPPNEGYSAPGKIALQPKRLQLPAPTHAISCGRLHATTLDENMHIWTILSFGRPFRLVTPFLDVSSPQTSPHQVVSGWNFSATLTKTGGVYVWFPWGAQISREIDQQNDMMNQQGQRVDEFEEGVIPCVTWQLHHDPHGLPDLPHLPCLSSGTYSKDIRLVKIAAMEHDIVGLTNQGHVIKFCLHGGELSRWTSWEYLPLFSEPDKIKEHLTCIVPGIQLPDNILITHISAQFSTFVAYSTGSSSVVLMGTRETDTHSRPEIIPSLQNRNVISVVIGDYHYGALTSTGKLLTWGNFSRGALGLGDPARIEPGKPGGYISETQRQSAARHGGPFPPRVTEPTEVRFDHDEKRRRERFCFAATAAGWHMGALAIDLEPDESDEDEETVRMPGGFPPTQETSHDPDDPGPSFPFAIGPPHLSIYRIGFPGRGGIRGWQPPRGRGG